MKKSLAARRRPSLWKWALAALAVVLAVWAVNAAVGNMTGAQAEEGCRILEDSLRRAVVNSYTSLGRYPATLEDVTERYGIDVNEELYAVYYEVFADNIMPDITVVPLT